MLRDNLARRSNLEQAFAAWTRLLGANRVTKGEDYGHNTVGIERAIPLGLRPESADQLPELVRIAHTFLIPLYPVSSGNNWGYGAANPHEDGCAVVDLSDLTAIDITDMDLGVVTIEPGVTQGMLHAFLKEMDFPYMVPTHGGGPDCSLMGNALERGYGLTPGSDHFLAVNAIEAILPNGQLYRGALSELGGETVDRLFKWGLGPFSEGLFSQGNFGIVTKMSIALARRPEMVQAFFFGLKDDTLLEDAVDVIREVMNDLPGVVSGINLLNARRTLSMMEPLTLGHATPENRIQELQKKRRVQTWTGLGAIYGGRGVVRAARKVIRRRLRGVGSRLIFLDRKRLAFARKFAGPVLSSYRHTFDTLERTFDILEGIPTRVALPLAYAKSGNPADPDTPLNPAKDNCGLLWYAPLVPLRGQDVRAYVQMVENVCLAHNIDPLITLTTQSERCFDSTIPVLYNRENEVEQHQARACFEALFEAGRQRGWVPYRMGVGSMHLATRPDAACWQMNKVMKDALDPQGIMSPGRYAV